MTERLKKALVRIYGQQRAPVGAGILVTDRHVLSCAHVVNEALGLPHEHQLQPHDLVALDFPLLQPQQRQEARVVLWHPVTEGSAGDITGLELLTAPPLAAAPAQFVDQPELWDTDFRMMGFPAGHDPGVHIKGRILGELANGYVQLEAERAYPIRPGCSGSPVWSEVAQGIVGIVVTAESNRQVNAGFMIPTAVLRRAWEQVSCRDHLPPPKP